MEQCLDKPTSEKNKNLDKPMWKIGLDVKILTPKYLLPWRQLQNHLLGK